MTETVKTESAPKFQVSTQTMELINGTTIFSITINDEHTLKAEDGVVFLGDEIIATYNTKAASRGFVTTQNTIHIGETQIGLPSPPSTKRKRSPSPPPSSSPHKIHKTNQSVQDVKSQKPQKVQRPPKPPCFKLPQVGTFIHEGEICSTLQQVAHQLLDDETHFVQTPPLGKEGSLLHAWKDNKRNQKEELEPQQLHDMLLQLQSYSEMLKVWSKRVEQHTLKIAQVAAQLAPEKSVELFLPSTSSSSSSSSSSKPHHHRFYVEHIPRKPKIVGTTLTKWVEDEKLTEAESAAIQEAAQNRVSRLARNKWAVCLKDMETVLHGTVAKRLWVENNTSVHDTQLVLM